MLTEKVMVKNCFEILWLNVGSNALDILPKLWKFLANISMTLVIWLLLMSGVYLILSIELCDH